jgi:Domain of unknown function (DUF1906)
MRWSSTAPEGRREPGRVGRGRRVGAATVALGLALVIACGGSAAAGSGSGKATTFTGYAFDSCNAPKLTTLQAWLASPYRGLGIYIGGANRACANDQLTPDWVAGAVGGGWNLIPLYVGLQAPCVGRSDLAKISPTLAAVQGTAAADDAVGDATSLGLPSGSPIYFDMEGYALNNPGCTTAVQQFLGAWVDELHSQGYLAGVYGSAKSTMRDLQTFTISSSPPDDIWIADWDGVQSVFGDPYVSDQSWTNHQRIHQYRGGHDETWGGVTIDVDSNVVDAAVVAATGSAPLPVTPTPNPSPNSSAAGSVSAGDGISTVDWPAGAFTSPVVVTLTPVTPVPTVEGFGSGGYDVQLKVQSTTGGTLGTSFSEPVTVHLGPLAGGLAPMTSTNGKTWKPLGALASAVLPTGTSAGYARNPDGSVDVVTTAGGYFALLPELGRPPAPASLAGHFEHGRLVLQWPRAMSASGPAISYQITIAGKPLITLPGQTTASLGSLHHTTPSVFRVVATDAAGKVSEPSKPLVVLPASRPKDLPKQLPEWAWNLFDWQQGGKAGTRPKAPKIAPDWYWKWAAWRAAPFRIRV